MELSQEQRLESQEYRSKIIEEIKGTENSDRMESSLEDYDIFKGSIKPYVIRQLEEQFSVGLVSEVPIVSSINILKKSVKAKATLYREAPVRTFTDLSDKQTEVVEQVYKDMRMDAQMMQSNELFELQGQTHCLIEPKNGRLTLRPVKSHQLNVVPSELDPETGEIFIFSSYDKGTSNKKEDSSDGMNQKIADTNDYDLEQEKYFIWSKSFHFVMNGKGEILTEDFISPLIEYGISPVIEIAGLKDFTYWIEGTNEDSEFTVMYNCSQSMLGQVVNLSSFAQAFLKTTSDLMPQSVSVGPTRILKLIIDPNVEGGDKTEFGYASPNADITGAREYSESLLSQYLSSQGLSPASISGSASNADKFTSGTDRFLAQIEKFEASKDAMDIYRHAETSIYKVIVAWLNVLSGSEILDKKYHVGSAISLESEVSLEYKMPTAITTDLEKLDKLERELELNLKTPTEAYAEYRDVSLVEAQEAMKEIEPAIDVE